MPFPRLRGTRSAAQHSAFAIEYQSVSPSLMAARRREMLISVLSEAIALLDDEPDDFESSPRAVVCNRPNE